MHHTTGDWVKLLPEPVGGVGGGLLQSGGLLMVPLGRCLGRSGSRLLSQAPLSPLLLLQPQLWVCEGEGVWVSGGR